MKLPSPEKILSLLRVRQSIGGLEISDSVLRFARFNGKDWELASVRLPPGVVVGGEVKERNTLLEALRALKQQINVLGKSRHPIGVVVSLSSINIYSQVFSLPMIEGENLEKAIQLNIQMVSPVEAAETYSGWQLVGDDQKSLPLEILSSFINRAIVDQILGLLKEACFFVYSIESRALSLTRVARDLSASFSPQDPYILLSVDSSGIEIIIIKRSQLYFQYFNSWRELQGEERQITPANFEAVILRSLHQVVNFYSSHWAEPIAAIFVAASAFKDEIIRIIGSNFTYPARELVLKPEVVISPEWFVALGSGLRARIPQREDKDISLLGVTAQEEFWRHQLIHFLYFWRLLLPVGLSILLLAFLGADFFLLNTKKNLERQSQIAVSPEQTKEMDLLQDEVTRFNRSVIILGKIQGTSAPRSYFFAKLGAMLKANRITLERVSYQGVGTSVTLAGYAASEEDIIAFKKAIDDDPQFEAVSLPLTDVKISSQGRSFSMTFSVISASTP